VQDQGLGLLGWIFGKVERFLSFGIILMKLDHGQVASNRL
jgi:hypothetical protein